MKRVQNATTTTREKEPTNVQVLMASDEETWSHILESFPSGAYTLFHTPAYILSWQRHESAQPVCLHLRADNTDFLYSFYLHPIPDTGEECATQDAISAYGYGGMVCSRLDVDEGTLAAVNHTVDTWFADHGVVAEFIREYPGIKYLRDTPKRLVRQNLVFAYEGQWEDFAARIKKRARRDAAASRKKGCVAEVDYGLKTLAEFETLYAELCQRKGLGEELHFGPAYFEDVRHYLQKEAFLVNIHHEGRIVAAALNFLHKGTLVYHLSASRREDASRLPNDLLLYTLLEVGAEAKCDQIFWGGGLAPGNEDSLFRFKEKYSTNALPVHIGTKVHNEPAYTRLCRAWERLHPDRTKRYGKYFLRYRY